jgi:hypothetical protein
MLHCDSTFLPLLESLDIAGLERHPSSVYGMRPDMTLAYFNPAWLTFSAQNGGEPAISTQWGLGCNVIAAISAVLQPYYISAFNNCLQVLEPWKHQYECSSAEKYRLMYMIAYPLAKGRGILSVHSQIIEKPHDPQTRPARAADEAAYLDQNGYFHQCAHCRRMQHATMPEQWDWVPPWVESPPPKTSHTICPLCLNHYYPEFQVDPTRKPLDPL